MLRRFYELRKGLKIAMVQLEKHFDISDEVAAECLYKEDAELLLSEKVNELTTKET